MNKQASGNTLLAIFSVFLCFLLSACASGSNGPKPVALGPDPAMLSVRLAWTSKIGAVNFPLQINVAGQTFAIASSDGVVTSLDAHTGAELWRANAGTALSAGVGSDGYFASVVTRSNELLVFAKSQILWRFQLDSQVFTSPLVAGARVFVLGADRSMSAFDAATGRRLWRQQQTGDPLVLRQSGVLMAVGNTLVFGQGGHLKGVNPANGSVIWDASVATPRGTNDIERLVDLVSGVSRHGKEVCVRAFQAAIGCVDTSRGLLIWKKPAVGAVGLSGDDTLVFGVEEDGRMLAWKSTDGDPVWTSDSLRYRRLSAPLVLGRSVLVGDEAGQIHLLARTDGSILKRLSTDGSAIAVTPVEVDGTLIVVTRHGSVFGFQPG
jgi:outer membrane assembly lipoprotein YfgL